MPSLRKPSRPTQAAILAAAVLLGTCVAAAPAQASTTTAASSLMYKISVAAESNSRLRPGKVHPPSP